MSVVVSHPTGNANVRAVLRGLGASGLLDSFWTTLAVPPHWTRAPFLGERARRELGRRAFPEVPWTKTRVRPIREIVRLAAGYVGAVGLTQHESGWASADGINWRLDCDVAAYLAKPGAGGVRAVYAYEDVARNTFTAARPRGIQCIYDLPIAHWRTLRRLLQEEAALHPAWAPTMEGLIDSSEKLARKDEELVLADEVIVPSTFTRESLKGQVDDRTPISIAQFGAPPPTVTRPARRSEGEPLHVLFAGHLSQRKGFAYLIAAMSKLRVPWRLSMAGPKPAHTPVQLDAFLQDARCNWLGHVPHSTLLEIMSAAHVFVLPSIVEGLAMVQREAMSAGLPLITTANAGGTDIIADGQEGFIVPIRNPDAIAERLTLLYEDEARREKMAVAALASAGRSGWDTYETRISQLVEGVLARCTASPGCPVAPGVP
jgi:glycosyltransferase involved in cell wall biosynthesis